MVLSLVLAVTAAACSSAAARPPSGRAPPSTRWPSPATRPTRERSAAADDFSTRTPIKHVVVIVGENRTFDHVFATYKPKHGQRIDNLLVEEDHQRGRHARPELRARPPEDGGRLGRRARSTLSPGSKKPLRGAAARPRRRPDDAVRLDGRRRRGGRERSARRLHRVPHDGRHGPRRAARSTRASPTPPACRRARSSSRRASPTTPTRRAPCTASTRCGSSSTAAATQATFANPAGCRSDLFPWVEVTIGAGSNGAAQPGELHRRVDGRRLDGDGLLQRAPGRRAVLQVARRHVRDERQLPPVDPGRHRRQPRRARHGSGRLVQRRQGQPGRRPRPSRSRTRTRRRARTTGTRRTATRAVRTATAPIPRSRASARSSTT